jgi:hypothetical protein
VTGSPGQEIWVKPTGTPVVKIRKIFTDIGDLIQNTKNSLLQFLKVVLP